MMKKDLYYRPKIFCAVSSYFRDSVSVKWDLETKENGKKPMPEEGRERKKKKGRRKEDLEEEDTCKGRRRNKMKGRKKET